MDHKVYCLTFLAQDNEHFLRVENWLTHDQEILGYWNYIPLVYCFKSRLSATDLTYRLAYLFPHGNYMVAEVNPGNLNGRLPAAAWNWFYAPPLTRTALPLT